jgi:hypothetical protein
MWQRELAWELNEAATRERSGIISRYKGLYGQSSSTLYRIAKEYGFNLERKERNDKGGGGLNKDQLDFVAAVIWSSRRENKGAFMPVENALEFAIDNGIILRGEVGLDTVQRQLRELEMDKTRLNNPTPHVSMRSLHPNHCHLVDVSTCIQFYLSDGGMQIMREDEFYKNKIENFKKIKEPLQRYLMTDHFSGFFFVKYYLAAGETAENLFDFACCAWEAKQEQNFPFQGLPKLMLMDGGSRAKAKAMGLGFWDGLEITILPGNPGNSRRQGSVEVTHNIWEKWFETRLRFDPATDMEDLNRKARGFCIWFNASREHSRTKMTRLACWLMIQKEQLRIMPERSELQDLLNKPEEERTVVSHRISFQGKEFNLSHTAIPHGAKVKVIKNLFKWKEGIVTVSFDNRLFEVKEIGKLAPELGGFRSDSVTIGEEFKSHKDTTTQTAVKRLDELAYGANKRGGKVAPFTGLNAFEGFEEKVGNVVALPKRGTPVEVARSEVMLPIIMLLKLLRAEGVEVTPALNKELRERYGDTIDNREVIDVVKAIVSGGGVLVSPEQDPVRAAGGMR